MLRVMTSHTLETLELITGGNPAATPVAVIQHASLPQQRHALATLDTLVQCIADTGLGSPSVIVVGDVVHGIRAMAEPQEQPNPAVAAA